MRRALLAVAAGLLLVAAPVVARDVGDWQVFTHPDDAPTDAAGRGEILVTVSLFDGAAWQLLEASSIRQPAAVCGPTIHPEAPVG